MTRSTLHALAIATTTAVILSVSTIDANAAADDAAMPIRLVRWEEPAVRVPIHAPGAECFRLIAKAQFERGTAVGPYQLQVVAPDGQIETRPLPAQELAARRFTVLVRSASVRNVRPSAVVVRVRVLDAATGAAVSTVLNATIRDFPHPSVSGDAAASESGTESGTEPSPFGWGEPLSVLAGAAPSLPRHGPDGLRFVRIPAAEGLPGFFLAATEATNAQVKRRLAGYDPKAGRSDEFTLEDTAQPALGLSPKLAQQYVAALSQSDPAGVTYRLPNQTEWLRAARAGGGSAFWWGDEASYPAGANFLGPEPSLATDTTALPGKFEPNPWGLVHTFGNVAEWATTPSGGFVRLGGHFRTEPASPMPDEAAVDDPETTGPDAYVGVRPAFDLSAEKGAELIRKALRRNARLTGVKVAYDPDRDTATLTGTLSDPALRRDADRRLGPLWFLAAVENRIATPEVAAGTLATLGDVAGTVRRITPLGRWIYEVPIAVRWGDPLPVSGSEWWVNVYPSASAGGHFAHKLIEITPNPSGRLIVLIDRGKMAALGLPVDAPVVVALSLGAEAPSPADPHVVSNLAPIRWKVP
jgi:hypothetical protein